MRLNQFRKHLEIAFSSIEENAAEKANFAQSCIDGWTKELQRQNVRAIRARKTLEMLDSIDEKERAIQTLVSAGFSREKAEEMIGGNAQKTKKTTTARKTTTATAPQRESVRGLEKPTAKELKELFRDHWPEKRKIRQLLSNELAIRNPNASAEALKSAVNDILSNYGRKARSGKI